MNTSASATSSSRSSRPSSTVDTSMPMQRLPRFMISHMNATPTSLSGSPPIALPINVSGMSGATTLITSAPQSPRTAADAGANAYIDSSTTFTPSSRSYGHQTCSTGEDWSP